MDERVVNGTNYFVAVPGEEYYLKVFVYRDSDGKFPFRYIRIAAYVDGMDVNYWKRLDMSNENVLPSDPMEPLSATFWGFKKSDSEIQSFRFANMHAPGTVGSSSSGSGGEADAGQVKVDIFEAEVSEGMISNLSGCHEVPTQTAAHSSSQKFWSQPSVTTVGGKKLANIEKFVPIARWSNKPHPVTGDPDSPLLTLNSKYHTGMILSTLEEIYTNDEDAETAGGGGDSACASTSSGRKRAPARKPKSLGYIDLSRDSDSSDVETTPGADAGAGLGSPVGLSARGRGYVSIIKELPMVDMSGAPSDSEEGEGEEGEAGSPRKKARRGPIGVDSVVQERVETYMETIPDDSDSDCD